jgi:hypothetical protein
VQATNATIAANDRIVRFKKYLPIDYGARRTQKRPALPSQASM